MQTKNFAVGHHIYRPGQIELDPLSRCARREPDD